MRDRLTLPLPALALVAFVLGFLLVLAGGLGAQTTMAADPVVPTATGYSVQLFYTVGPRDSLHVVKRLGTKETSVARYGSATTSKSYSRAVTFGASSTGRYTFTARRYAGGRVADSAFVVVQVGPAPVTAPTLAILSADTTVSTRVAGDTTYTTRRIITTRGTVDTTSATTVTVAVHAPPPPSVTPLDSVTVATVTVPTWDTMKVSMSPHAWPYPQAGVTMTGTVLMDGVVVGKIQQTALYTTVNVPRPVGKAVTFQVCVAVKGTLPASPQVCGRPRPYTDRVPEVSLIGAALMIAADTGAIAAKTDSTPGGSRQFCAFWRFPANGAVVRSAGQVGIPECDAFAARLTAGTPTPAQLLKAQALVCWRTTGGTITNDPACGP